MNTRQTTILDLLASQGEVGVQDLAQRLDVSVMTVRRDLTQLKRDGHLTRTHGGAVLSHAGVIEFAFLEQSKVRAAEKAAIAKAVAAMVRPGMTVTLDTGTTTLEVARAFAGIRPLTVLTSSLAIASALYAHDHIELVLLGGTTRKGSPDLSGWLTEENLKRFRVDLAVLGADGADADGAYTTGVSVARVSQAMIAGAKSTVLALDHTKLGKAAFVRFAEWGDFGHVVTDAGAPGAAREWLGKAVKQVTYARI
jgi:DeoR/GlpR family transcriptional regulator of sugar metabolism